jgi:hypothetical protein
MQNAGSGSARSGDRNDSRHSIVSDLVSLIEHVQASMGLIESAIAMEAAPGRGQVAADLVVLDDVTPRYQNARAALSTCNARLGMALLLLLGARALPCEADEPARCEFRPVRSVGRA